MRENYRTYADNGSTGKQQGRNKAENNPETGLAMQQEESTRKQGEWNGANSEGMVYLDIIPRFAL